MEFKIKIIKNEGEIEMVKKTIPIEHLAYLDMLKKLVKSMESVRILDFDKFNEDILCNSVFDTINTPTIGLYGYCC